MDSPTQPSLSAVGKQRRDRKRKSSEHNDDDDEGSRVRVGAPPPPPPPSASNEVPGAGFGSLASMLERRGEEGGCDRESKESEYERVQRIVSEWYTHSPTSPARQRGASSQDTAFTPSIPPARKALHMPPVGTWQIMPRKRLPQPQVPIHEDRNSLLTPKMHGAPPGAIYGKRKRSEVEGSEDEEVQERSKKLQPKAALSSGLLECDTTIAKLSFSGLIPGKLLPCGEIFGFEELPPVAQLYDLSAISLAQPQPQHAWIQQTWRSVLTSVGVPTWHLNQFDSEISNSGTERKELTYRAIKTFRELAEGQDSIVEVTEETLNLLQKEMDYIVLLLLVHRHQDHLWTWEERLRVLFARLQTAPWPRNAFGKTTNLAPTRGFGMQT